MLFESCAHATSGACDPNYDPCVPIASDVDCASGSGNGPAYVRGPVRVIVSTSMGWIATATARPASKQHRMKNLAPQYCGPHRMPDDYMAGDTDINAPVVAVGKCAGARLMRARIGAAIFASAVSDERAPLHLVVNPLGPERVVDEERLDQAFVGNTLLEEFYEE